MEDISFGYYHVYVDGDKRRACVDVDRLAQELPHGSGIDGSWNITVHQNGNLTVSSEFHCMDENGMYDGWEDFSFRIFRATTDKKIPLAGLYEGLIQVVHRKGDILMGSLRISERKKSRFGLGEYLHDTCYGAVEQFLTKRHSTIIAPDNTVI